MWKKLFLFCLLFAGSYSGYCQSKSLSVGVKLVNDLTFYEGLAAGVGGQVVYRMKKHGGIETGLYYSSSRRTFLTYTLSNVYIARIAERRLYIPILYRFDSKALNFTVGPVVDYFLGWEDKSTDPGVKVNSYSTAAARLTGSASLSKSIHLSPSLILEPEARFNYILSEEDRSIGINIALRKKLF